MAPAKSTKSPAFQFYPEAWFSSSKVLRMSHTERGIYIDLLAHCWLDNGLPTELHKLAGMLGIRPSRFARMWTNSALKECFVERGCRLQNARLDRERTKQRAFSERQSLNGSKGGRGHKKATALSGKPKKSSLVSVSISSTQIPKEQESEGKPHPIKEFLTLYETLFVELTGERPILNKGRDAKIAKTTLENVGHERAHALLRAFFASPDPFIQKSGYGLNVFSGQLNKLIVAQQRPALVSTGTDGRGRTGAPPRGKYSDFEGD